MKSAPFKIRNHVIKQIQRLLKGKCQKIFASVKAEKGSKLRTKK